MTATCTRCERGHNLPKRGAISPERCPRCLDAALHAANAEVERLRAIEARLDESLANAERDDVRRALEYVRGDKA